MKDDLKDHAKGDRTLVEDDESWEARKLAQELGVTPDELSEAVEDAGLIVSDTQQHVGKT
ncbi:MAG TPA: DUF3606 domain-containing protein [Burkholderiales bacterium]|nr:DUF3606 domain-containing protein [Burkholderiales bacterium]